MKTIKQILMDRDELSEEEANDIIGYAKEEIMDGVDIYDVVSDYLELGPEYVFDLV
jgi:uncharacterized tellurite resistance protein B-like protein